VYTYIVKRLLLMIPTLFGAAVLVFYLLRAVPGDPCEIRLAGTGLYADPAEIELCQKNLGLDRPLYTQFFDFVGGLYRRPRQLHVDRQAGHL
jgi:peptide/nickel transport system permease protein